MTNQFDSNKVKGVTMPIAIITGSLGLIGAQSALFFSEQGFEIVGIDNNFRESFFGKEGSTEWNQPRLQKFVHRYKHHKVDIRNIGEIQKVFSAYNSDIKLIIHCAAQPSHDWATNNPLTDFTINANGTLNILEMTRQYCPNAIFIYTSTNKVYGDTPNHLPLAENATRWEVSSAHPYFQYGIDESMSTDHCMHTLYGCSKTSADLLVQEYGRYFGIKTGCFRCTCLTGSGHAGVELHGFLSYLVKCALTETLYTIYGHKGKQVRDNVHAKDLVQAFWHFFQSPRSGEVYNLGGGRKTSCSILEAISICEQLFQKPMNYQYSEDFRAGDVKWWITDSRKFHNDYPGWKVEYSIEGIIQEIGEGLQERLASRIEIEKEQRRTPHLDRTT